MEFLFTVSIFIIVLGIMIFVHEFGHFVVAKWAGVKVLEFNLGMGPKLLGRKWGETDYMLKALPIGGSVKMLGEEPGETDEEKIDPADIDRAFYNQAPYKRIAITAAGPILNIALAIILAPMIYILGIDEPAFLSARPVLYGVETGYSAQVVYGPLAGAATLNAVTCSEAALVNGGLLGIFVNKGSPAAEAGFRRGDEVLAADGESFENWQQLLEFVLLNPEKTFNFKVLRNGKQVELPMTTGRHPKNDSGVAGFIPAGTNIIGKFTQQSPARNAGMDFGDKIVRIDGRETDSWDRIVESIRSSDGKPVTITVLRSEEELTFEVTPEFNESMDTYLVGISPTVLVRYPVGRAIKEGFSFLVDQVAIAGIAIKKLVTGQLGRKALGGPIEIAVVVGNAARMGFTYLLKITAIICVWLGVLNLFPFPALDGGHIIFALIETVSRRRLNQRVVDIMNMLGFSLLMALILFVSVQDIIRHWDGIKGFFLG